ncbi:hypothetical protein FHT32_004756 [Variovorax sp. SG517]|uniref:hypothetical protein n=1 Tax=Variovorax sp. SG517 TaxID=2587117 RepID=UPI00159EAD8F|nr:hypothetical protein [Variovorax sp. SG517]NVM91092.1 hypothetical protein [Variovorax sp. SG517]
MVRDDLSDRLIHLTRGTSTEAGQNREEAIKNLESILDDSTLKGGDGFIKGKYVCTCFSEVPVSKLPYILAHPTTHHFKYEPYGVMVDKRWLFQLGGRPVIYGPEDDYNALPEDMKYRHVRFHLDKPGDVDFTWEREWRLRTDALTLDPAKVTVILPDRSARDAFANKFKDKWHYLVLSDLGVPIPALLDGKK